MICMYMNTTAQIVENVGKLLTATLRLNAQNAKAKRFIKHGKQERMIDNFKKMRLT